jgi:phenylacetate-coenzyme A ligase PaaK-like adenylate-forming protein
MVKIELQKWQQFTSQDAAVQELKLKETLRRASQSPMYKKLWKTANFNLNKFQNINDLNQLPCLNRKTLFETTRTRPNNTCTAPISQWFLGHDKLDTHEWYPYSGEDFMAIAPLLSRLSQTVGLHSGDIVLTVVDTPPHISSFIPYLWSYAEASKDCGLEFINGSLEWYDAIGMSWITFIQKRQPTAIIASKRNADALAEKLKTMGTSIKAVLPQLRVGIFFGEDTTNQLEAYSGLETFDVYSPIEHMALWSECKSHNGVHVWLDNCIPEILPEGKTEAQLLCRTAKGTEGELVITSFSLALPLVRYKTGKHVRVESVGQCACGANHPKVTFIK